MQHDVRLLSLAEGERGAMGEIYDLAEYRERLRLGHAPVRQRFHQDRPPSAAKQVARPKYELGPQGLHAATEPLLDQEAPWVR